MPLCRYTFDLSIYQLTFGLVPFLAIMSKIAVNIHGQVFV